MMNKELMDFEKFEKFREEYKKNNFIYRHVWKYSGVELGVLLSILVFLLDFIITYFFHYSYIYTIVAMVIAFILGFCLRWYAYIGYSNSQRNYFKEND